MRRLLASAHRLVEVVAVVPLPGRPETPQTAGRDQRYGRPRAMSNATSPRPLGEGFIKGVRAASPLCLWERVGVRAACQLPRSAHPRFARPLPGGEVGNRGGSV